MSESGYLEITVPGQVVAGQEAGPAAPWQAHARLEWQEGGLSITDLGGLQPLIVNGAPLEPRQPTLLNAGDTIEIAGVRLAWRSGELSPIAPVETTGVARYALIVTTPGWTRELPLQGPAVNLGRAEENEIIINNKGISRRHARLEQKEGGYEIVDLGSTFGLQYQGRPISRRMLADGDRIQIAEEVSLTFKVVGLAPGVPAAKPGLRSTVVVPREQDKPLEAKTPPAPAGGSTVVVPRQPAAEKSPPAAPPPEAGRTIIVPRKEAPPPAGIKPPSSAGQTSHVDMIRHLEGGGEPAVQATGLWETGVPHLVIYVAGRTWQALFTQEHMSIGRGEDNHIVIPDSSVSRRHATVDRKGDDFIIRDAGSDNGVWLGEQRIESHKLRPGDVVNLGRAKVIFKGGFTPDDLTLIGAPAIDGKRKRRPVVFVPGMGGSELWLGSERVYPVPKILFSNPEILSLPGDPRIEARQIVSDVVVVPGIFKQEQYSRLGDYLVTGLGYTRGVDLLEFAYDWRQDIRLAAQRLAETIDRWRPGAPVTIIGHSLGTLVTRYYVERLGGKRLAERIILMGGPHYGTPKAVFVMLVGPGVLPFGIGDDRIRQVMSRYPTSYQILPIYPCVFDQYGRQIDVLEDQTWLPEGQRPFLQAARSFRNELGYRSSVPTVSIFGYGFKTAVRIQIERRPEGGWQKVSFVEELAGDLSVPAGSAVLKNSEIHPVFQEHGALYVDNDVKMRLKVELTRSTTLEGKKK